MPEGDTIHRTAIRLVPALVGSVVIDAQDNHRFIKSAELLDARFERVEARGKHLLMHLTDNRVLHSHMGMTGSWHVYNTDEKWRKAARCAALSMQVGKTKSGPGNANVVCFSPKTMELLTATQFRRHPYLNGLGPDLMVDKIDEVVVLQRFRSQKFAAIGEAVMNQTVISGIGNVYKSEALFLTKTDPFTRVGELTDAAIIDVVYKAQSLMRKNINAYPRQTRLGVDGGRLWVYGRLDQPCFNCGTQIRLRRQGDLGRSTYWCPACQMP